jgi:hypothetical protein
MVWSPDAPPDGLALRTIMSIILHGDELVPFESPFRLALLVLLESELPVRLFNPSCFIPNLKEYTSVFTGRTANGLPLIRPQTSHPYQNLV